MIKRVQPVRPVKRDRQQPVGDVGFDRFVGHFNPLKLVFLVIRLFGHGLQQPGLEIEARFGERDRQGEIASRQGFALKRRPYRLVRKSARVPARDREPADMHMIAVGVGHVGDRYLTRCFIGDGHVRVLGEFLQQRECTVLQFIQFDLLVGHLDVLAAVDVDFRAGHVAGLLRA